MAGRIGEGNDTNRQTIHYSPKHRFTTEDYVLGSILSYADEAEIGCRRAIEIAFRSDASVCKISLRTLDNRLNHTIPHSLILWHFYPIPPAQLLT